MSDTEQISLQDAADIVKNGATITFSGFTIWRRPCALVFELIRKKKRGLHLIEINSGPHSEFLIGAGCVAVLESSWIGHEAYGKFGANFSRKLKNKELICEDYSHFEMGFRFLAGSAGMPYIPTQTAMGTDLHNPEYDMLGRAGLRNGKNPKIPLKKYELGKDPFFKGGQHILVPAARVDVAVLAVQQAGAEGTLRIEGQFFSDPEIARAADITIVLAEEIVPEEYLRREPRLNTIPDFAVDYIVECPYGAHPTGMSGFYEADGDFIRNFYMQTRTQEGFDEFAREWIFSSSHNRYLEKLGTARLINLKANRALNFSRKGR